MVILDRYKDPDRVPGQLLLPVYCNQKPNEYLKEIRNISGINKKLFSLFQAHLCNDGNSLQRCTYTSGIYTPRAYQAFDHAGLRPGTGEKGKRRYVKSQEKTK